MDDKAAISIATSFLKRKGIAFEEPITANEYDDSLVEVVFSAPGASDPTLVVDPPDVRVRVDMSILVAELVQDM